MGMHFGVIATTGTTEELLGSLEAAGRFRPGGSISSLDDAPERDSAGETALIAGEHEGRAYLLDPSLILAFDPDLLVDASRRLFREVLGIGAETTSGTYTLIAAHSGRLTRLHWTELGGLTQPYDVGTPLPGEPDDGLDDVDGLRLRHVLSAAGYDFDRWADSGRKVVVDATYGEPVVGPESEAMNAYFETHRAPGSGSLEPVVAKRDGGFDLVAPGSRLADGTRVQSDARKPGLLGRLFGR